MSIAITAASGRLGHAILREFLRRGQAGDIVAVSRDPARITIPGIATRAGDYGSVPRMAEALAGIDTAIVISAPVAGGNDRIALHRNVIEAACEARVRRVIYTSVIGNGLEMETWFGATQKVNRQAEADLEASGLEWVIGRNALYLELDVIQMRNAVATGVYSNPAGSGRCSYLGIDEIAVAYAQLAIDREQAGQIYNISGEAVTQAQIVALAAEVFDLDIRYEAVSDEAMLRKFRDLMPERGEAVALMLAGCFQAIRAGAFDVPSHYAEAAGRPAKTVRRMLEELR